MIRPLLEWLDHRTGVRGLVNAALYEHIPGGARWRYVWGSTLVFAFVVQMITGFFLWACYSPSSQTAWESVYYIQHEMFGGWLLRGIHHFMAQAMIILLVLHMAQVIIDGAYRAPREVNFWIGLVLLQLVLGLSLTGYLLPWDQKGYWATQVATNLMGIVPVFGPELQRIVVGGTEYGHATLTRFFAFHAGLLPFLMIVLIAVHVALFRRHGLTAKQPYKAPDSTFWVDQVLKDGIACLAVLAVVVFLSFWPGAELGAPADGSVEYSAARPEWYFLFLYQFLKFESIPEFYGAIVIPGSVMGFFFLMPLIGRWNLGHRFNIAFFGALMLGIVVLTGMAMVEDRGNAKYRLAVEGAKREAERIVELAQSPDKIPPTGAITLIRSDPMLQGPRLFAQHCASCHRFDGHDGTGVALSTDKAQSASDLKGFASRAWVEGVLDPAKINTPHYFGATKFKEGKMANFMKDEMATADDAKKAQIKAVAAAVSAEAQLKSQREIDSKDAELIKQGREHMKIAAGCADCHTFRGEGEAVGPDLTGYGSRQWLADFIADPAHKRFYGTKNDRMPSFGVKQILNPEQIFLIADWLRGDWFSKDDPPTTAPATTQP